MSYAVEVSDGVVRTVIVGTAEWANANLDGMWVDSDVLVGVGWLLDGEMFSPPVADEVEGEG
jgi:hypothetical protein